MINTNNVVCEREAEDRSDHVLVYMLLRSDQYQSNFLWKEIVFLNTIFSSQITDTQKECMLSNDIKISPQ